MLFISTYVHGNALTPLGQFVVDILFTQFATNPQQIVLMKL